MVTISEAAQLAHTSRERVYKAIEEGNLTPIVNKPRMKLLDSQQVDDWGKQPKSKGGRPKKEKEAEG